MIKKIKLDIFWLTHQQSLVVALHQLMSHLDENFPDAQQYIPERWIKGDVQESQHHPVLLLFSIHPLIEID